MTVYKLAGQGLSQQDSATIDTTLDLASGLDLSGWQRSDLADAQVLILNIDDDDGALCWQSLNARPEIELPVILISNVTTLPERSVQLLHSPISYPFLLSALKQIERRLIELAQEAPLSCFGHLDCNDPGTENDLDPIAVEVEFKPVESLSSSSEAGEMIGQESTDNRSLENEPLSSPEVLKSDKEFSLVAGDAAITQELNFLCPELPPKAADKPEPRLSFVAVDSRDSAIKNIKRSTTNRDPQESASPEPVLLNLKTDENRTQLPDNVVALKSSDVTPQQGSENCSSVTKETNRKKPGSSVDPETQQMLRPEVPAITTPDPLSMSALMRPARMYYPSTRLLGLIRRVISEGRSKEIYTAGFPPIQIFPISKAFIFSGRLDESEELFKKPPFEFDVREIKNSSPPALKGNEGPKPISILLYTAALFGSEGKYCQHAPPHGKIKLSEKPDFEQLPHTQNHLKLAEHLLQNSADLLSIAKDTGCELNEIVNFHNACCELHLVEHTEFSNPEKTEASCPYFQQDHEFTEKKITFFDRIKKRFANRKTEDEE